MDMLHGHESQQIEITVESGDAGRMDKFLSEELSEYSRSYLQNLIQSGNVYVNGRLITKSNYKLESQDKVMLTIPEIKEQSIEPENIPLDIIYEDEDLIVVNKPKGMVVHPAAGHFTGTLVNALMYHCHDQLSGINGELRPGIVHRIDMNTTGVLVACKNDYAHRMIAEQLSVHSITRKYEAVCHNCFKETTGTVDAPIGRNPLDRKKMAVDRKNGRNAVTHYTVLQNFRNFAHIECQLETGRTHQIRVHMASIGHPLLGDSVYTSAKSPYKQLVGQTLHARVLGFIHPRTKEYMEFEAPLPDYFTKVLSDLERSSSL
jgi:23S rRNA pseudouridine1911/1915/1917 synthase